MNSLLTFYTAARSTNLYCARVIPADGQMVAIEKHITVPKSGESEEIRSDASPSAVHYEEEYFIFYKGADSNNVYSAKSPDGINWSGNERIKNQDGNDIQSSMAPESVVFDNKMYLIYKGGTHDNIYISGSSDGTNWEGDSRISDFKTNEKPSALVWKDNILCLFYKGADSGNINFSYYPSNKEDRGDNDPINGDWGGNKHIAVGEDNIQTAFAPAGIVFNDQLCLVYTGKDSGHIYFTYSEDGEEWHGNHQIKVGNTEIKTYYSPSCAIIKNGSKDRLCVIYKAYSSDKIYIAYTDNGENWHGDSHVFGIQTGIGPNCLQESIDVPDFLGNLLTLSPNPESIEFTSDEKYPDSSDDACHIQGIQTIDSSCSEFVLTASNFDVTDNSSNGTFDGLIIPVKGNAISPDQVVSVDGFGHAGGIQAHGATLLVPLAVRDHKGDDQTEDPKKLNFYDAFNKPDDDLVLTSSTLVSPKVDDPYDAILRDAQAAGYLDLDNDNRLVFVLTSQTKLQYNILEKTNTSPNGLENWKVLKKDWDSEAIGDGQKPQAINLFENSELYYMISFRNANLDNIDRDALGVYTFRFTEYGKVEEYKFMGSLYLDGDNMRRAGGLNVFDDSKMVVSSFGKTISKGDNTISIYLNRDS